MATDHIHALSVELNSARFEGLHLYRRNAALHPVAVTVNCILGCFISGNAEPLLALIPRCRTDMAAAGISPFVAEYLGLVEAFLDAIGEWTPSGG